MRVLLIEDEGMSAQTAVNELTDAGPAEVTLVRDPDEALVRLDRERYDVAVVDLLYQAEADRFEKRRREGRAKLTDSRLLRTGLAALKAARAADIPAVLWTNGDVNRRLHMAFAYQELACRSMCPKDAVGKLAPAVRLAISGHPHIDGQLQMHLPSRTVPSLRETFFHSETQRAVWRAMALGLHDHARIGKAVGVKRDTVKKRVDDMRQRLVAFDQGCSLDGPPTPELVRYASQNREFFLDDTVREAYP